jgi:hypothetical protein
MSESLRVDASFNPSHSAPGLGRRRRRGLPDRVNSKFSTFLSLQDHQVPTQHWPVAGSLSLPVSPDAVIALAMAF